MYINTYSLPNYTNSGSNGEQNLTSPSSSYTCPSDGWIQLRVADFTLSNFTNGGFVQIKINGFSIKDYYYKTNASHILSNAYYDANTFAGEAPIDVCSGDKISLGSSLGNSTITINSFKFTFIPKKTS